MCHYSIKMKYVCIWSVNGSSPSAECPLHFSLLGSFESIYWFYLYYLIPFPVCFLHNFHLFILLNVCATKVAHKASVNWLRAWRGDFFFLKAFFLFSLPIRLPSCVLISECVDTLSNQQVMLCSLNSSVWANWMCGTVLKRFSSDSRS